MQEKIELLEIKLAYQEDTIESLNQTVIAQQVKISQLEKTMSLVIEKMQSSATPEGVSSNQIELPPHY
jgi:SlyX protein